MATKKSINICILFGILIIAAWLAKSEIDGVEFFSHNMGAYEIEAFYDETLGTLGAISPGTTQGCTNIKGAFELPK